MKYKLAYIGKIIEIEPIKKADFIVSATVVCGEGGKWKGTVKKDQFVVGQNVEVYLQDALLPKTEEFAFMEQHKYRVSMRKFKKVPSECLIMPLSIEGNVGDNIADLKDIRKYEKPISTSLSGIALGSFPTSIIHKTDEPNFQTVRDMIRALQGRQFYSTVKADGSSGTIYKTPYVEGETSHFGCCSRNLEFRDTPEKPPVVWQLARKYDLEKYLPMGMAIQFEMVGPGIQKNHLGLDEIDMRVFNVWHIEDRRYFDAEAFITFCETFGLPTVEILDWDKTFTMVDDDVLRKYAEGKYTDTRNHREGVVIRPMEEMKVDHERLSFKVINLNFKD